MAAGIGEGVNIRDVERAHEARLAAQEAIVDQVPTAYQAYRQVMDHLNDGRDTETSLWTASDELLVVDLTNWLSDEKLDYVVTAQEADPELRFTLVIAPNVAIPASEIGEVAQAFGNDQPSRTYFSKSLSNKYTAEQVSSNNPQNPRWLVFSLIPSKTDPRLLGTVDQQREAFAALQIANPSLKVPSILEAITYWHTLRAQGDTLTTGDVFERTHIRHFDLPEHRFDEEFAFVPGSCVYNDGRPYLMDSSNVGYARGQARIAVG